MNQRNAEQRVLRAADVAHRFFKRLRAPRATGQTRYAAWDKRALATVLDVGLYGIIGFLSTAAVFTPLAALIAQGGTNIVTRVLITAAAVLFLVGPLVAVPAFMLSRKGERNGQTPAKKLLGLRVVREDEQPWTFRTALYRQVVLKGGIPLAIQLVCAVAGFWVDRQAGTNESLRVLAVALTSTGLVGASVFALWPLFSSDRRGLHDRLAGSRVVNAPSGQ